MVDKLLDFILTALCGIFLVTGIVTFATFLIRVTEKPEATADYKLDVQTSIQFYHKGVEDGFNAMKQIMEMQQKFEQQRKFQPHKPEQGEQERQDKET